MKLKAIYRTFKKPRFTSSNFITGIILLGLLSSVIANDKPVLAISKQGIVIPILSNNSYDVSSDNFEIWPLIPYSPQSLDFNNMNSVGPFEKQELESTYHRHWLGTDELGRDLLAGLIHGCKTAVLVGFGSMIIALLLGLFLGGIAGYFQNDRFVLDSSKSTSIIIGSVVFSILCTSLIPWEINSLSYTPKILLVLGIALFSILLIYSMKQVLSQFEYFKKSKPIAIDNYVMQMIELLESIPLMFLIVSLSALFTPSHYSIIVIIGISSWTGIAKFTRAEVLKIKEQNYVESSLALGLSNIQIIRKHILPNALPPIFISLAFGIASAILIEATLSFLGIGLGAENVSWGSILSGARSDYQSWWLVVFPGLLLFFTVYSLNQIGEKLSK